MILGEILCGFTLTETVYLLSEDTQSNNIKLEPIIYEKEGKDHSETKCPIQVYKMLSAITQNCVQKKNVKIVSGGSVQMPIKITTGLWCSFH